MIIKQILYPFVVVLNKIFVIIIWIITFPIVKDKRVFFVSYFGKSRGDNPGAILNYLKEKNKDYDLVLAYNLPIKEKSVNIRYVYYYKYFNPRFYYYLFTSKVIINNSRFDFNIRKKRDQLYIQTWHGGGAEKKVEKDVEDVLPLTYVRNAKVDSSYIDIFLSDSHFMSSLIKKSFWYDGSIFEIGYPRYEVLIKEKTRLLLSSKVRISLNIDDNTKILFYAPTFRNDFSCDAYDVDFDKVVSVCEKKFKGNFLVLVRLHPNMINKVDLSKIIKYDFVDVTSYPDSQELLATADVLISDYSSIVFDFCLMNKPVFRYVKDLEKYKGDRNFYFNFEEYPFPFAKNNAELIKIIESFDEQTYHNDLIRFFNRIGQINSVNSTEIVSSIISDYNNGYTKSELNEKYDSYIYKSVNSVH